MSKKKAVIIVMDRIPNGRKPVMIKRISCGAYTLFNRDEKTGRMNMLLHGDVDWLGMINCIRTAGQLDKLREAIREHMEKHPGEYS